MLRQPATASATPAAFLRNSRRLWPDSSGVGSAGNASWLRSPKSSTATSFSIPDWPDARAGAKSGSLLGEASAQFYAQRCRDHKLSRRRSMRYERCPVAGVRDTSSAPLDELLRLSGRVAVVTGGARGNRARLLRPARRGGRHGRRGRRRRAGGARGGTARSAPPTVAAASTCARRHRCATVVERTVREAGRLDVWVNAAGVYPTSPLLDSSDDDWDLVLDTNLRGTFLGAQRGRAGDGRRGRGRRDRERLLDGRLPRGRRPAPRTTSRRSSASGASPRHSRSSSAPTASACSPSLRP